MRYFQRVAWRRLRGFFAHSPSRISLPRYGRRVGLHIDLFEACSAFTRVAACTLARSPLRDPLSEGFRHFVASMPAPVASGWSDSPGGPRTHWKAPPCHGAPPKQSICGSLEMGCRGGVERPDAHRSARLNTDDCPVIIRTSPSAGRASICLGFEVTPSRLASREKQAARDGGGQPCRSNQAAVAS